MLLLALMFAWALFPALAGAPLLPFCHYRVGRWLVCAYMLRSLLVLQLQLLTGFQRLALEASFGPGLYIRSLTVIGKSLLYV